MPITVNEGGTLYTLDTVHSNEGGTLYELDTIHENDGGILYEIHSSVSKSLSWSPTTYLDITDNGLSIVQFHGSAKTTTRISSSFRFNGTLTVTASLGTTYYAADTTKDYGIRVAKQIYLSDAGRWNTITPYYYFKKPSDTGPFSIGISSAQLTRIEISPVNIGSSGGSGSDKFTFSFAK